MKIVRHAFGLFIAISIVMSLSGHADEIAADNWPQWRGPTQNGVSNAIDLPTSWSTTENVIWKTQLPHWSGATPIIWGDDIFVMSASKPQPAPDAQQPEAQQDEQPRRGRGRRGGGRFGGRGRDPGGQDILLFCISRADGTIRWQQRIDQGNQLHMKANNASPSPVTDGEHVWVVTGNGGVAALDLDGGFLWRKNLQEMYGDFGLNWGYASSPLLHEGTLIIEVLHGMRTDEPSYVVAFDAKSGEEVWKVDRPTDAPMESPDAYTTPVVLELESGKKQIVISGGDYVTGHDPATGQELWRASGLNPRRARNYRIVASPVAVDGMIYAPTRVRPLLALTAPEGDTPPAVAWTWDQIGSPDVPTPVCDGNRFYMINDAGMATCADAKTGEVIWGPERTIAGTVSSSPVLADGKIYFTNEDSITVILDAGPEFSIVSTNELDGSYALSSPVPLANRVYIRTGTHLYCIGE